MRISWKFILVVVVLLVSVSINARVCEVDGDCAKDQICTQKACVLSQPLAKSSAKSDAKVSVATCEKYLACVNDLCETVCYCKSDTECGVGEKCNDGLCTNDQFYGSIDQEETAKSKTS